MDAFGWFLADEPYDLREGQIIQKNVLQVLVLGSHVFEKDNFKGPGPGRTFVWRVRAYAPSFREVGASAWVLAPRMKVLWPCFERDGRWVWIDDDELLSWTAPSGRTVGQIQDKKRKWKLVPGAV